MGLGFPLDGFFHFDGLSCQNRHLSTCDFELIFGSADTYDTWKAKMGKNL